MHKHLTGALSTGSRHDHRLKTTVSPRKVTAVPGTSISQGTAQYAGGSAAASAGASMNYTYSSTEETYTQYQQDQAAGPLHSSMPHPPGAGPLRSSGNYPGLPVSQIASSSAPAAAAAASRLNVALAAAMSTSPSKARPGTQSLDDHQQHEPSADPGKRNFMQYSPSSYNQQQFLQQQYQHPYGGNSGKSLQHQQAHYYPEIPSFEGASTATGAVPTESLGQKGCSRAGTTSRHPGGITGAAAATTAAAAVQLAAGVSLTSETVTSIDTPDTAPALKKKRSGSLFSKASKKKHQQQQHLQQTEQVQPPPLHDHSQTGSRRKTSTTTFGMRLSGSVMAAFNGWLVNEAVNAAASAATAAFAEPTDDSSKAAAATAGGGQSGSARYASRGGDGASAAAATTPSKWSFAGLLSRATSLDQQQQQQQQQAAQHALRGTRTAADTADQRSPMAAAMHLQDSVSSSDDDDYMPGKEQPGSVLGRSSSGSTDDSSNLGDVDAITSDEEAEAAALAAAAGGSYRRKRRLAGGVAAALGLHERSTSESSFVFVQRPDVARKVKAVRAVLLWHKKSASWKALGLGLYLVMLVGYIPQALHYMQLTTLLPGVALLYLTYNLLKPWAIRVYCKVAGTSAGNMTLRLAALESSAADYVIRLSSRAAAELGSWALAVLSLAHRALRGQRFTTSAWTILSLWLLLLVSELRVLNQTLLAMLAYVGLFSIPWLYNKFKRSIDTVVYETMHFLTLLVVHAERWAYCVALLAAGLIWQLMESEEGSFVVRGSAAALAAVAVLVWRVAVAEP